LQKSATASRWNFDCTKNQREIFEKGYNKIKTYGVGRDLSLFDWQNYIMQLLNAGLMEIAYDEGSALKLTDAARAILFDGKKIDLVPNVRRPMR